MTRAAEIAKIIGKGSVDIHGEAGTTSSGSTGKTTNLQQGLAKCWHLHDHAGGSILDSFNVTSFTDQGTGHYRTVIASDMASANYVTTGSNVQGDTEFFSCFISDGGVNTATNCDYKIVNVGGSLNDNDIINVVIHGDLA
tara:strand:+ start:346 stop:765 length:420 start_codon:yes stop_codon:yes gene_type:complete